MVVGGARLENWQPGARPSKARALFQYLADHRDRPIRRETLIEALWPNPDAVASGTSLKVTVHALRQLLKQIIHEPTPLVVEVRGSSYQLSTTGVWIDTEQFERYCAVGRRFEHQGQWVQAIAAYGKAAELYQGDFLPETWDEWALFRREGLRDQYLSVLTRLAESEWANNDLDNCILHCQRILQQDRCREDTYRTLLRCHGRLGQLGRVQFWFQLCLRTLRAELGVAPDPETVRLYEQLMSGTRFPAQQTPVVTAFPGT